MKPSRWSGSRDWSPACMPASASSRRSASLPGGDAELAAAGVERIAAEEPQDDLGLAADGPAPAVGGMVLAVAFAGSTRAALASPPKASCVVASSWCRAMSPRVPDGCLRKLRSAPCDGCLKLNTRLRATQTF